MQARLGWLKKGKLMARNDAELSKLLQTQQSLTEWLEDIGHEKAAELKKEDNLKRERLKVINRITGLPFDEPVQFEAIDLAENSDEHKKYLAEHGEELCALRIIPKEDGLEKLRMRGLSKNKAYEWFKEQDIDPEKYTADYIPHVISEMSTIFVVNDKGIFGEIIEGSHTQLTQGFHNDLQPIVFQYDWNEWRMTRENADALNHLEQVAEYLNIKNHEHREKLSERLGASFANDYLKGYFETTDCDELGILFIDYNQTLGEMYADAAMTEDSASDGLSGQVGSPGSAKGKVQIVHPDEIDESEFVEGSVLVCEVTTPDYVPVMRKAAAIITDQGGILSHAAIVARELGVPCIVGTDKATKELRSGQMVIVDADEGSITRI